MTSPTIRKLSAAALAAVGVIHLALSPEYLGQQAYIGALFIAGGLFLCGLAVALWRADNVPSWLLGALAMAGMGIAFVLSRTTGLPGFKESEWELSGIVALVLEAGFVAAAIGALSPGREPVAAEPVADERRFSHAPAAGTRAEARREADVTA
jgi:peptidoglycan/LPS O-acetylase OafA/YrhL